MNHFGGNWTENKIDILVDYAKAYLIIMKKYAEKYNWKLMYFDGFAGSGLIINEMKDEDGQNLIFENRDQVKDVIVGAAKRILEIEKPMSFDEYYFVEKDKSNFENLTQNTVNKYTHKKIHTAQTDCNEKMLGMSKFLQSQKGKKFKVLAYIDPCGMQLEWSSLEALKGLSVDMWILIPSGMGVNRLLTSSGEISEAWLRRLGLFLGMPIEDLKSFFYDKRVVTNLFGDKETVVTKLDKAINRSAELYSKRLGELFDHVSETYVLRNKSRTTMYHFLMVSNNKTAVTIANDIIRKYKYK